MRSGSSLGFLAVVAALVAACASTPPREERAPRMHLPKQGPASVEGCKDTLPSTCVHAEVVVGQICYGTDPGPNAEHSRRMCVCHECLNDGECGANRRCAQSNDPCGAPRRICVERCQNGACQAGYSCVQDACMHVFQGGPP